jgi:lipopolysaccharide transport system permease protein
MVVADATDPMSNSALIVADVSAIPDEPPDDSWYHHKVRLVASAKLLWDHREIMYTLAERDFRAQYKQATLGILWALLAPVATLVIFVVVFSRVKAFPTQGIPYALYAFVGILCWSFFSSSLGGGGNALLSNKALLAKTQFPRECFPLETMLVNALNTVLSWVPLAILFVIFGRAPAVATVWVPLFMVIEVVFAAGMTLALSSLIIQMRDLVQVLPIIISLGIFATPVIWPFSYVPTHYHLFGGHLVHGHWVGGFYVNLQVIYGFFNPLGPVISSVRTTMLLGHNPSWAPLLAAAIGAILYLVLGYRVFKRFEVNFADIA